MARATRAAAVAGPGGAGVPWQWGGTVRRAREPDLAEAAARRDGGRAASSRNGSGGAKHRATGAGHGARWRLSEDFTRCGRGRGRGASTAAAGEGQRTKEGLF